MKNEAQKLSRLSLYDLPFWGTYKRPLMISAFVGALGFGGYELYEKYPHIQMTGDAEKTAAVETHKAFGPDWQVTETKFHFPEIQKNSKPGARDTLEVQKNFQGKEETLEISTSVEKKLKSLRALAEQEGYLSGEESVLRYRFMSVCRPTIPYCVPIYEQGTKIEVEYWYHGVSPFSPRNGAGMIRPKRFVTLSETIPDTKIHGAKILDDANAKAMIGIMNKAHDHGLNQSEGTKIAVDRGLMPG